MKSIASLVLGLLTFLLVFGAMDPEDSSGRERGLTLAVCSGILSLAFACFALRDVWRAGGTGKGFAAIAGVLVTFLSIPQYYFWQGLIRVRSAGDGTQVMSSLKQLGVALLEYEKAHGAFPAHAVFGKEGKPLLSWRVLVLPYLEQEDLFKQFRLNESWDSPHNLALLSKMPDVYSAPENVVHDPYTTFYQVLVGRGTIFDPHQRVSLRDVLDGASQTLLVVEGGHPVPWTKPADIACEPDGPLPELGGVSRHGFAGGMADGSVLMIRKETTEATIRAFVTRSGKDIPGSDW